MESNLLYSKSTNINVNFTENTLTENTQNNFEQISGHCGQLNQYDSLNLPLHISKIKGLNMPSVGKDMEQF